MATQRDYYEILGVARTATAEEIRKAHRKLVRQYHPDVHKNDAQMEGKFKADKATGINATFQFDITGDGGGQWNAVRDLFAVRAGAWP